MARFKQLYYSLILNMKFGVIIPTWDIFRLDLQTRKRCKLLHNIDNVLLGLVRIKAFEKSRRGKVEMLSNSRGMKKKTSGYK